MQNLTDQQLLEIYKSDFEYSYISKDGQIIHFNEDEKIQDFEDKKDIEYLIFHSDFETVFNITNELKKRNIDF